MLQRLMALALIGYSILLLEGKPAASSVDAPAGAKLLMEARGEGSQVYTCSDGHWVLKAPDAKLLDDQGQQIGTHFAGPTWKLTDGSEVKGKAVATQPAKDSGTVPWLLVDAVAGTGTGKFSNVAFIRRTDTQGGAAGSAACTGGEQRVPYSAKYSFYTAN